MNENKFYDVHFHLMNLSYPNFRSFVDRFTLVKIFIFVPRLFITILAPKLIILLSRKLPNKKITRQTKAGNVLNLPFYLENDISSMLLLMEKTIKNDFYLYRNNLLHIGDKYYSKIVLTPLIIDFWYENMKYKELFCGKESTYKPVTEQVTDLFRGIKEYKDYHEQENNPMLFEIYPFLGLNTSNYPLETEDDQLDPEEKIRLREIMRKYFKDYTQTEPQAVQDNQYNYLKRMLKNISQIMQAQR